MAGSRISKFYKHSVQERLQILNQKGILSNNDLSQLRSGQALLNAEASDKMVENVIGVFGLPLGLGHG